MGPSLQRRQTWMAELWPWQPRTASPRQAFSASLPLGSNPRLTVNCIATPCFFYDGPAGPPEGAASGEALAVSPSLSSARTACMLKGGGYLSIATQGSYWLSSPHPLALTTALRPGIPATAETRSRAGTRGRRAERGAKARAERHTRTSPSNLAPADARTRPHTRERPLILEISYRPEAPATVAPSLHLMPSRVSDATLLSHKTTAAWAPKGTS